MLDYKLVLSPWLVNGNSSLAYYLEPVFWLKTKIALLIPEQYRPDLTSLILQGEVAVSRCRYTVVGYLTLDPYVTIIGLEKVSDPGG